jgi:hypothetical protein
LNKFEKKDNKKNVEEVIGSYKKLKETHLSIIKNLSSGKEISRWDNILSEYVFLQDAHDAIAESKLSALLKPEDFRPQMQDAMKNAARENYQTGISYLKNPGRYYSLKAYEYLRKAGLLLPELKDATSKADSILNIAAIKVVVNTFEGDTFYLNNKSDTTVAFNNAKLVSYLENLSTRRIALKFYSQQDAKNLNINPDLLIDIKLTNMTVHPSPVESEQSIGRSESVVMGIDSTGKEIREWIAGSVNTKTSDFTSNAQIEIRITDLASQGMAVPNKLNSSYSWQTQQSTVKGNVAALSGRETSILNRFPVLPPTTDEIISSLFRKLYPPLIDHINKNLYWASRSYTTV